MAAQKSKKPVKPNAAKKKPVKKTAAAKEKGTKKKTRKSTTPASTARFTEPVVSIFNDKIKDPVVTYYLELKEKAASPGVRKGIIGGSALLIIAVLLLIVVRDKYLVRTPLLVLELSEVSFVYGDVKIKDRDDAEWEKAEVGDILAEDIEIQTGNKSRADITFNEGTAIRISSNTHFILNEYNISKIEMQIDSGSLFGKFKKLFQEHGISVKTPTATASIRGTELGFEITELSKSNGTPEKATIIYALSGVTEVYNPARDDERILLSYQDKTTIPANGAPGNPENMTNREVRDIMRLMNAIHEEKVLLVTNKILFETGSARLLPESNKELDSVADRLEESDSRIRIVGHTDNVGSAFINQVLSIKRAKTVRRYLIKKGISPSRLYYAGYGSSKPIEDNSTEEGRRQNRRVEFVIID